MENNGRSVVVLHPEGTHEIVSISDDFFLFHTVQKQVGGYVEMISTDDICTGFIKVLGREAAAHLVCGVNDEGKTIGLPWNLLASYTMGYQHPISGNAVYMMLDTDKDDNMTLSSLTDEQSTAISIILSACGSRRVSK